MPSINTSKSAKVEKDKHIKKRLVNKKNSPCQQKAENFLCGLEDSQSQYSDDSISSDEDFISTNESCISCKIRMTTQSTPCNCKLVQCVCNQVRPVDTKNFNSLYKRVVHPSYEAIRRKRWWRGKPDSDNELQQPRQKQFLNLYLSSKPPEFLAASSVYNLPQDSDDNDSNCECDDINQISFYTPRESLDLSGRKTKGGSIAKKSTTPSTSAFHDGLSCYKMFLNVDNNQECCNGTLPGLLMDLYCTKTKEYVKEKLTTYIQEQKANKDERGFFTYIYNKHFKKKSTSKINLDSDQECRMKEMFLKSKIKKKKG